MLSTVDSRPAGAHLQWGVLVPTPSGTAVIEPTHSYTAAEGLVDRLNRAPLGAGDATLVYREVVIGDWRDDPTGTAFGVRRDWPDGHREHEPADSRADAERLVRAHHHTTSAATATVVSRGVTYGDWWLAAAPVSH